MGWSDTAVDRKFPGRAVAPGYRDINKYVKRRNSEFGRCNCSRREMASDKAKSKVNTRPSARLNRLAGPARQTAKTRTTLYKYYRTPLRNSSSANLFALHCFSSRRPTCLHGTRFLTCARACVSCDGRLAALRGPFPLKALFDLVTTPLADGNCNPAKPFFDTPFFEQTGLL